MVFKKLRKTILAYRYRSFFQKILTYILVYYFYYYQNFILNKSQVVQLILNHWWKLHQSFFFISYCMPSWDRWRRMNRSKRRDVLAFRLQWTVLLLWEEDATGWFPSADEDATIFSRSSAREDDKSHTAAARRSLPFGIGPEGTWISTTTSLKWPQDRSSIC